MLPILITTTNEKQPDAAVAWDPLAGNPIATFTGEMAGRLTISEYQDGIACAASKKPFIQLWNLRNAASNYKRVMTKGLVSTFVFTPDNNYILIAFDKEIYIYQTNSGCLVGFLDKSHSAKIGLLKLTRWSNYQSPLLISADISGFLACWSLGSLIDELSILGSGESCSSNQLPNLQDSQTPLSGKITPLWFIIQASHGLPQCDLCNDTLLVAGSQGLKIYDLDSGDLQGSALIEVMGGLHSLCSFENEKKVFCGSDNGLLYTVHIRQSEKFYYPDKETRRCFTDSNLSSTQKAIVNLVLAPQTNEILVVGSRCGLIEILRPDSLLTRLQRFSVLNPSLASDANLPLAQLTGLCLIPRPNWLAGSSTVMPQNEELSHKDEDISTDQKCGSHSIEPFKRYLGWRLDDVVRMQLPGRPNLMDVSFQQANLYMDDFYSFTSLDASSTQDKQTDQMEHLKEQIDKVTHANRLLLSRLVAYEMKQ